MKMPETLEANFKLHREAISEIGEHYDGCVWASRNTPIDECMCDCYTMQIFKMGMDQERDNFYLS